MTQRQPKQHIEQIRRDKFGIETDGTTRPNALEADLRAAMKHLAEELNAKETHFILELLQNAEDNTYSEGVEPELSISVEATDPTGTGGDGCLCLLNNEVGFTPEQVLSLCSVGQSTKEKARGYIGEKGIGFKSVFRVSDQPHIFSNGYQFRFTRPHGKDDLGYIVPHWVDSVPSVVRPGFTAILLPLVAGKHAAIAEKLLAIAPETILFLDKISRLGIGRRHFVARDRKSGLVKLSASADESLYFVHCSAWARPAGLVEEKRVGIDERDVTVALPLQSAKPCSGRVFAFLPTEFDTGLPFLVNADFLLSASRDNLLEDRRWNAWLRDRIAPTFTKAFLLLVNDSLWRTEAYRFLPLESDLLAGADYFAPAVEAVQNELNEHACVLTSACKLDFPSNVRFAGELARRLLCEIPPDREKVALLHPDLERHWERLKPLGVESLTFAQLFDALSDDHWLSSRNLDWWEILFELLVRCDVRPETVGSFPILRCQDGKCRPRSAGVFFHAEGRPILNALPAEWPSAHFFDADLQCRLQTNPSAWAWMTAVGGLRPFSVQRYIVDHLLSWMREQPGEQLVQATRHIAANLEHIDEQARQTLRQEMPWLLANGRVVRAGASGGKEVVTPEALEEPDGWNKVFVDPADRQHFHVLSNSYTAGLGDSAITELRELFSECGVTDLPEPARFEDTSTFTRLQNWGSPRWLENLTPEGARGRFSANVGALERWLDRFEVGYVAEFLCVSKYAYQERWDKTPTQRGASRCPW
jgi:hypothetical protein